MKFRHLIYVAALSASACTINSEPGGVNAQFNPPLVYQHWQLDHYTMENTGTKVCAISSGSKGVTVIFNHRATGDAVFVKSNYLMQPGITLSASANGHNFMSYDTFFPTDTAKALVDNMEQGDKLYLEWVQKGGASGNEPIRTQNVIMLDDFKKSLNECRNTFK